MKIVKLSSKRQITIPKNILGARSLEPGDRLVIHREQDGFSLKPFGGASVVNDVAGSLGKYVASSKKGASLPKVLKETKQKTSRKLAKEA